MELSRENAWALLTEWTETESLRKHALAVEAAVRGYARRFGEDEQGWGVVALLHDFDYERYPTLGDHPVKGCAVIKRMKDKAFARAVPRDHLKAGAEELGLPLDQHVANVISYMREQAEALGLKGNL
jgi:predicted hydrolase (HD superfamily)